MSRPREVDVERGDERLQSGGIERPGFAERDPCEIGQRDWERIRVDFGRYGDRNQFLVGGQCLVELPGA
jgi:hypothetical protein